jgi:catechol-2,3-dioxygenase
MAEFYREHWGLEVSEYGPRQLFLRGEGPNHHLLILQEDASPGLHHVAFEVAGKDDLERAAESVAAQGLTIVSGPGPSDEPGISRALRFIDPAGQLIELYAGVDEIHDHYGNRIVKPQKLNHIMLRVPSVNDAHRFYTETLGFKTSDWLGDVIAFIRCNANHHVVALSPGPAAGLNHVAFEVRDWDDITRGIFHLGEIGVERVWGPGRHAIGSNLFSYWMDPEGNIMEYTCQVEQIRNEDTWRPRIWPVETRSVALWGGDLPEVMR